MTIAPKRILAGFVVVVAAIAGLRIGADPEPAQVPARPPSPPLDRPLPGDVFLK